MLSMYLINKSHILLKNLYDLNPVVNRLIFDMHLLNDHGLI